MILSGDIRNIPSLRTLDNRSLNALAGVLTRQEFSDGEFIFRQGQKPDRMHILLKGHVRVSRELPTQGSVGLVTLGPGALFGALACIDSKPRAASCMAWGTVQLATLTLMDFNVLMEGNTPAALRFQFAVLQTLFSDIRTTNRRVAELATLPTMDGMLQPMA